MTHTALRTRVFMADAVRPLHFFFVADTLVPTKQTIGICLTTPAASSADVANAE